LWKRTLLYLLCKRLCIEIVTLMALELDGTGTFLELIFVFDYYVEILFCVGKHLSVAAVKIIRISERKLLRH